jgi:DnaJ-class molecular chaperone
MIKNKQYRICTECRIRHYENCETCFGFGVYRKRTIDGVIPIPAYVAMGEKEIKGEGEIKNWEACPECHSTPNGIPKN